MEAYGPCLGHADKDAPASSLLIGHGLVFQLVLPAGVQSRLTITPPRIQPAGAAGSVVKGRNGRGRAPKRRLQTLPTADIQETGRSGARAEAVWWMFVMLAWWAGARQPAGFGTRGLLSGRGGGWRLPVCPVLHLCPDCERRQRLIHRGLRLGGNLDSAAAQVD